MEQITMSIKQAVIITMHELEEVQSWLAVSSS